MATNSYDLGDLVRVTTTFTTAAGVAVDPTAVLLAVKNPAGKTTTYTFGVGTEIVKSATGIYYMDVNANAAGWWFYRWYSTGTGQAAAQNAFRVNASNA